MGGVLLRLLASLAILGGLFALMLGLSHPPLSAFGAMAATYGLVKLWRG